MEVVVLNCWVTETNETPWELNSSTSLAKSASDLLDPALKLLLLTGQRPGEVAAMQAAHIAEGWLEHARQASRQMAGRERRTARIIGSLLSDLSAGIDPGPHRYTPQCADVEPAPKEADSGVRYGEGDRPARPTESLSDQDHWPRLRSLMGGIGSPITERAGPPDVYDRHSYAGEDQRIMAAVARHIPPSSRGQGPATSSA